jgi:hypothetical protein
VQHLFVERHLVWIFELGVIAAEDRAGKVALYVKHRVRYSVAVGRRDDLEIAAPHCFEPGAGGRHPLRHLDADFLPFVDQPSDDIFIGLIDVAVQQLEAEPLGAGLFQQLLRLEPVDTVQWYPKVMRKDFTVGLSVTEAGVDDPDQQFYENYVCGAERNYTDYCSPEVDKLVDQQSMEPNQEKRNKLVWEIEKRLAEDGARPVIFYPRGGTCRQPWVKGLTIMVNSIYNGWRYEDVWLDK